jgi:hypothetical protein
VRVCLFFAACIFLFLIPAPASAWSHQGHILLTRLTCLRIINDPSAPPGLVRFLRENMPFDIDSCRQLALHDTVGTPPPDKFLTGLDGWCTWPDRIKITPAGMLPIPPYGVGEGALHYGDLEYFAAEPFYRDDLSNRPRLSDIPRDRTDPRWKLAGFVPFRVEECFDQLTARFSAIPDSPQSPARPPGDTNAATRATRSPDYHPDYTAAQWAGMLAHYVEDSAQPHHATMDSRSLTYLAGRIPSVPAAASQPSLSSVVAPRVATDLDPHGNMEFSLFLNDTTLERYREEFWTDLQADILALSAVAPPPANQSPADPFNEDLKRLLDSYTYLPLIGRAAQAAYAGGTYNADLWFSFPDKPGTPSRPPAISGDLTIVQLIALQNAKAVLDLERYYRSAWAQSR